MERILHSSRIGNFLYDPSEFVISEDGLLRYIGDEIDGNNIIIPEGIKNCSCMFEYCKIVSPPRIPNGVKRCDFMFAHSDIFNAPRIPKSVESAKGMFKYCHNLEYPSDIPTTLIYFREIYGSCIRLKEIPKNLPKNEIKKINSIKIKT